MYTSYHIAFRSVSQSMRCDENTIFLLHLHYEYEFKALSIILMCFNEEKTTIKNYGVPKSFLILSLKIILS